MKKLLSVVTGFLGAMASAIGDGLFEFMVKQRLIMTLVSLPDGSTIAMATTYGSPKTVSAVTNANPAVATSAAHGISGGAFVEITSGWQKINSRIARLSGVATPSFNYEGLDTTDTNSYPAGSGIGSVREIQTFTQIQQIIGLTTSGGDQQYSNFSFLENDFETQLPTITSAQSLQLEIADDASLPGYIALKAASGTKSNRAFKLTLPNGAILLYNGVVSLNETPKLNKGSVMTVTATIALQSRPVRY